ncbi:glycerophosphodiester phosphodiesterase [Nisaea acidiphila]|uniref:Glycerophosphodiester phosphodiesterase n=1 Tax=Nisaea acidiphila TaxID=1862145 RepID=A0A9J7AR65_9PROT|nr:glycerophosphodiester phosphodiesterase [Nisaea acidiphila]UUX49370.1 glycerophosphodiester phosphodiesterase [Nisaea acidiphila]
MREMRRAAVLALAIFACTTSPHAEAVEIQGHRGARGLLPENTLPAFSRALELGVDVLELDTVVSADGVAFIHHDRALSPDLARSNGAWISEKVVLHGLTADEIANYDVGRIRPGSRYAKRFPDQNPVDGTRIPQLAELFRLVSDRGDFDVRFNIETKRSPLHPGDTPDPEGFARTVIDTAKDAGMAHRIALQSFDWSTLIAAKRIDPAVPTVCLTAEARWLDNLEAGRDGASPWLGGLDIDDHGGSVQKTVKAAGCAIWSPYYRNVTREAVAAAHAEGLEVVVWTVNKPEDMKRMADFGVDGIITDYPDRAAALRR